MKILHFILDDKFTPLTQKLYEEAFPGSNTFLILHSKKHPSKNIKVSACVRKVPEKYFRSEKLRRESEHFDVLIVHSMMRVFADGVKTVNPRIFVVWCGWGYDYYPLLAKEFGSLCLEDSLRLSEEIRVWRMARPLTPAMFAEKLKNRILKIFLKQNKPKSETLSSVAGRIDLFSVLPTEVEMLQRALPELCAEYLPLRYYTTEDVLAVGPERMAGRDILLGNSPTPENNHVEALKMLQEVLPAGRNIIVPLNYGALQEFYGDKICKLGRDLFGERFQPLRTWMPLEQYHAHLSRCGVVIMNHRRQQALGVISAALYKGAKVFLRPENPVYSWYLKMGVIVFSTEELNAPRGAAFEALSEKDWLNNRRIVGDFWSREKAVQAIRSLAGRRRLKDGL